MLLPFWITPVWDAVENAHLFRDSFFKAMEWFWFVVRHICGTYCNFGRHGTVSIAKS